MVNNMPAEKEKQMTETETQITEPRPRIRAKKAEYKFHEKRDGDTVLLPDSLSRRYYVTAFLNWMREREGNLHIKTLKTTEGYLVTFHGISPTEVVRAQLGMAG